ncbi:MAG: DJ-1/PfpI family protein [Clostridia bacterium]|nr:DJ-1/PfpI family protein [Clostridia bacterium]
MIYLFLAEGFEEMEALAPVDILRRAGLDLRTVGVTGKTVTGSHNIPVTADIELDEVSFDDMDMVILPGGMPGTLNLEKCDRVKEAVSFCVNNDKYIAAICAAPGILGRMGVLNGKNATCFPGHDTALTEGGADYTADSVTVDGKFITGKGAGVATEFALEIVEILCSEHKAQELHSSMQCK